MSFQGLADALAAIIRKRQEALAHYEWWREKNVKGTGYGKCREVTAAMERAFPELRRVRGHYQCLVWGERTHWWMVTSWGEIVDPTRFQFPTQGDGNYVEFLGCDADLPTGVCPNCGNPTYRFESVCSNDCASDYAAYLNEETRRYDRED